MELAVRLGLDPAAVLEDWAERAAIREIDGGLPRDDAERAALEDLRLHYETSTLAAGEARLGPRSAPSAGSAEAPDATVDATAGSTAAAPAKSRG